MEILTHPKNRESVTRERKNEIFADLLGTFDMIDTQKAEATASLWHRNIPLIKFKPTLSAVENTILTIHQLMEQFRPYIPGPVTLSDTYTISSVHIQDFPAFLHESVDFRVSTDNYAYMIHVAKSTSDFSLSITRVRHMFTGMPEQSHDEPVGLLTIGAYPPGYTGREQGDFFNEYVSFPLISPGGSAKR